MRASRLKLNLLPYANAYKGKSVLALWANVVVANQRFVEDVWDQWTGKSFPTLCGLLPAASSSNTSSHSLPGGGKGAHHADPVRLHDRCVTACACAQDEMFPKLFHEHFMEMPRRGALLVHSGEAQKDRPCEVAMFDLHPGWRSAGGRYNYAALRRPKIVTAGTKAAEISMVDLKIQFMYDFGHFIRNETKAIIRKTKPRHVTRRQGSLIEMWRSFTM